MTAVLERASARPTWRYLDDAPPVSSPSRKRRLGAVLTYLAATAGVGVAIFWPTDGQALVFSEFKIPPSPFTASAAAGPAPEPNTSPAPKANRLAVAADRPLRSQLKQSRQYLRPAGSVGAPTTVAVVRPDTPHTQVRVPTWVPESDTSRPTPPRTTSRPTESQTAPNQIETRQRPRSRDTNPGRDLNHPFDTNNSEATKPSTSSTPQPDSTPTPDSTPKTATDSAPASPPNATDNPGLG
jgi:hypothetical protein